MDIAYYYALPARLYIDDVRVWVSSYQL